MSNLSGVVDMLDEHPPELIVTQHGSVLVSVDECVSLRFRTMAALDAWLEDVDRQRAAIGCQQTFDVDAYHERVQSLRSELRAVR